MKVFCVNGGNRVEEGWLALNMRRGKCQSNTKELKNA
jgi:hypothetical protein